ncbi:hypothetical protein BTR23_10015 [Alkalihalophilus pseudofirmus]|uniref:hypothetical protein n=1 Tax=Alkalihalobacterium alkalinitrilicum TaxID=427920 RepID=UPI00094CAEFB|nr:hypothetical protein [Alkalihalobacterium alkalinitrilicum]OLO39366.1 hypothetical protein BTR23_10015 [Alkalihalophilus pseudofirmus]
MTKKQSEKKKRKDLKGRRLDNPDLIATEKESIFDADEKMQTVDPIPVEELNEKVKDEKNHRATKSTSSSEDRYPD